MQVLLASHCVVKSYLWEYCNVNDYLSVMKTLCIRLYRRTFETETMMNSFVYMLE